MSFFDQSLLDMLDVYIYESNDLFEQLDHILMNYQQSDLSKEDIHAIFRIMHTAKSSSAMMELNQTAQFMHYMEDLFSIIRDNPMLLQGRKQQILSLLYDVSDFMHTQLQTMKDEHFQPHNPVSFYPRIKSLIEELNANTGIASGTSLMDQKQHSQDHLNTKAISEVNEQNHTYDISADQDTKQGTYMHIIFETGCMMENVRALTIVLQLKPLCHYMRWYPEKLEHNDDAAHVISDNGFYIYMETDHMQQVKSLVKSALFVKDVRNISGDQTPFVVKKHQQHEKIRNENEKKDTFIPVKTEKLDELQNMIGELIIARETMKVKIQKSGNHELEVFYDQSFQKLYDHLEALVSSIRLVPFSTIVPKLSRVVNDIANKEQKDVAFHIIGEHTELDKEIIDHLFEPLMHLLRNAVDHGIEDVEERRRKHKSKQAEILLEVQLVNGEIQIIVKDDGKGLDTEKIRLQALQHNLLAETAMISDEELYQLILLPGFSTQSNVNEFSGRGVGLDVVKQIIQRHNGRIKISSVSNESTTFTLYFPLTLSISEALLFTCGTITYAVPMNSVDHFYNWDDHKIYSDGGHMYYHDQDIAYPIIFLDEKYGHVLSDKMNHKKILLIVHSDSLRAAFAVDQVLDTRRIVDKALPKVLQAVYQAHTGIAGYSLLGDGHMCYDLHIDTIIRNNQKGRE